MRPLQNPQREKKLLAINVDFHKLQFLYTTTTTAPHLYTTGRRMTVTIIHI
jgi:hypothetical protein